MHFQPQRKHFESDPLSILGGTREDIVILQGERIEQQLWSLFRTSVQRWLVLCQKRPFPGWGTGACRAGAQKGKERQPAALGKFLPLEVTLDNSFHPCMGTDPLPSKGQLLPCTKHYPALKIPGSLLQASKSAKRKASYSNKKHSSPAKITAANPPKPAAQKPLQNLPQMLLLYNRPSSPVGSNTRAAGLPHPKLPSRSLGGGARGGGAEPPEKAAGGARGPFITGGRPARPQSRWQTWPHNPGPAPPPLPYSQRSLAQHEGLCGARGEKGPPGRPKASVAQPGSNRPPCFSRQPSPSRQQRALAPLPANKAPAAAGRATMEARESRACDSRPGGAQQQRGRRESFRPLPHSPSRARAGPSSGEQPEGTAARRAPVPPASGDPLPAQRLPPRPRGLRLPSEGDRAAPAVAPRLPGQQRRCEAVGSGAEDAARPAGLAEKGRVVRETTTPSMPRARSRSGAQKVLTPRCHPPAPSPAERDQPAASEPGRAGRGFGAGGTNPD